MCQMVRVIDYCKYKQESSVSPVGKLNGALSLRDLDKR